ncbi:MAG TPA: HEAT repeat domain-containing protein [Lacipirellulaceae bacterium]|jgi:hypothetical protein|nr:HEAT repeat domain-containing protein [Lacipirellulaceae bacterium]
MNDSRTFSDDSLGGPSRPPRGEDLLPPIEQPSAKFIVQLFVVPALIVAVIVGVWLSFSWLVRSATIDPDKLVEGIEHGPSVARWQRAIELAEMLSNNRYAGLKRDPKTAGHIAQILDREIDESKDGNDGQEQATLRYYLVTALGRFEVNDGTDVLLKAAETKRTPNDDLVRQCALEAIATRQFNMQKLDPPESLSNPDLEPTLIRLTKDEDPAIRSRATYALGQFGTPEAIKRLEVLVDDPDKDTRFDAAIALAHRGNAKGVETLAEMLDVPELAKMEDSAGEKDPSFKRDVIVAAALDATHALARQNPQADLSLVTEAIERLIATDSQKLSDAHISPRAKSDAELVLPDLKSKQ